MTNNIFSTLETI